MSALSVATLAACSSDPVESAFDDPLPWHDGAASYEKLEYRVDVYDTGPGFEEDKRVAIGSGELCFELQELAADTTITMSYTVTYFEDADVTEKGCTDTASSLVTFHTNSLAAKTMTKDVTLADRNDDKPNLSYHVEANYFSDDRSTEQVAKMRYTKQEGAEEKSMALPREICRDNEMMFYLARAQSVGVSSSTTFDMINVFDCFVLGEVTEYKMVVAGASETGTLDLGDWVKDFGVKAVTDEESGKTSYPIGCIKTTVGINSERGGPGFMVYFSEQSFKSGDKEHKKMPVQITYSMYSGSQPYRTTVYTLKNCSFEK